LTQVLLARPVSSVRFFYCLRRALRALRRAAGASLGVGSMVKPARESSEGRAKSVAPYG